MKILESLVGRYPKIFCNRHGSPQVTLMCWGFECGEGWYNLLNQSCHLIQSHIDHVAKEIVQANQYNECLTKAILGDEQPLVDYYSFNGKVTEHTMRSVQRSLERQEFRKVPDPVPQVVAVQVKEKYGTLRFYYDGGDLYCDAVVQMAEAMSSVTCEKCGSPGKVREGGWLTCLCDVHYQERA